MPIDSDTSYEVNREEAEGGGVLHEDQEVPAIESHSTYTLYNGIAYHLQTCAYSLPIISKRVRTLDQSSTNM